ncbi:MAG: Nicotinate phosphoribosyltransferase [Clostridiales bacterium 38_11]|nr:MAG: Nicotinate phosphoribosyltransferase [Clostridiales bacterium 38_11]
MENLNWKHKKNLSMLVDLYELTMANGYLVNGVKDYIVYFDYYFRKVPDNGGFAITAGLEQFIDYLLNIKFTKEDLDHIRSMKMFSEEFVDYLKGFKFTGDIWAIPEGTPVFPNTPIITVKASVMEAQIIETMLLLTMNHQSLIATKANRIVRAANGKPVVDFGARRAHGADATNFGARACYIAGCFGTSNLLAAKMFGIPAIGTMAHSWIQFFDNDKTAFEAYAKAFPHSVVLLVDTYNVLKSGVPEAIKVFKNMDKNSKKGIRLDSGELGYLSRQSRKMMDHAGFKESTITASNSLDEYTIRELEIQNAPIDYYGVGERMITAKSDTVFGGVYKLVAVEKDGKISARIKLSEEVAKVTNPGFKEVWRLYDNKHGNAFADLITFKDEEVEEPYKLFDPISPWISKTAKNFTAKRLQVQVIEKGQLIYDLPDLDSIREHLNSEMSKLWDDLFRFESPDRYFVNLSYDLWSEKQKLMEKYRIN